MINRMALRQKLSVYLVHCKKKWQGIHKKLRYLWRSETPQGSLPTISLDECYTYQKFNYQPQILRATQWSLDEEMNSELEHGMEVEVEVEFYDKKQFTAKEDINRRITHFPPSHRLH